MLNEKGDYEVVIKNVKQAVKVSWEESVKLWKIATPLVINILCQYATGFVATVFLGHLGELQLSAVVLSTGVISGFTFGVLVFILHLLFFIYFTIFQLFLFII